MLITIDIPDCIVSYLETVAGSGTGKTREELAAHWITQGAWRACGENMGFSKTPADIASTTPPTDGV